MVKFLVEEHHADPRANDDEAIVGAAGFDHVAVVDYLAKRIFQIDIWRGKSPAEIGAEAQKLCGLFAGIPWPLDDAKQARDAVARHAHATSLNLRNEKRRAKPIVLGKAKVTDL